MINLKRRIAITISEYLTEQQSEQHIWYHGSNEEFDTFKLKQGTLFDVSYTSPIFLTSNIEFAKYYAGYKTPYIYKVKVLTDRIMDFRKLPNAYEIFMFNNKHENKEGLSVEYFKIGNSLLDYLYDRFPDRDIDRMYNNLLGGDYSSIEQTWIYEWLKQNKYDGAYVIETNTLNLFIFDVKKLKILSVEKL